MACELSLILLVDRGCARSKTPRRAKSYVGVVLERSFTNFCHRGAADLYPLRIFAVCRPPSPSSPSGPTGPPHARPLQSDGLMLDWIAVPDFLGDLSISAAAFTKYSNHAGFRNGPLLSKRVHGAGAICAHEEEIPPITALAQERFSDRDNPEIDSIRSPSHQLKERRFDSIDPSATIVCQKTSTVGKRGRPVRQSQR